MKKSLEKPMISFLETVPILISYYRVVVLVEQVEGNLVAQDNGLVWGGLGV